MIVMKFGGQLLADRAGLDRTIELISDSLHQGEQPVVVLSARGNTTDLLLDIIQLALSSKPFESEWETLVEEILNGSSFRFDNDLADLLKLFESISCLRECTPVVQDRILSYGELLTVKLVAHELRQQGIEALPIDSGDFIITTDQHGDATILSESERLAQQYFSRLRVGVLPVVTGFIGRTRQGKRTTVGRNGSNYTATWLGSALGAKRIEIYTPLDGIYTANPNLVLEAQKISHLSYSEATELAQYGAEILHHQTIDPLIDKKIPLEIRNSYSPLGIHQRGTLITSTEDVQGNGSVRALATQKGKSLIRFEGHEMMGRSGIDARIFGALSKAGVSVSLVSQGSSERGIGIVLDSAETDRAIAALNGAFAQEIIAGITCPVKATRDQAVVALIGVPLSQFDKPYSALVRHGIVPKLINIAIPSNTLCLLIDEKEVPLALNVMHGVLFDKERKIHLAVVGHGTVGGALLDQIVSQREELKRRKGLDITVFAISNSRRLWFTKGDIDATWREHIAQAEPMEDAVSAIIRYAKKEHLENLIFVDNTSSTPISERYTELVQAGFDLVSSNKVSNVQPYEGYLALRRVLSQHRKSYRYETNVGAGLPLIDYLKLLHLSGDRITSIRGLFSGSLGYIFNALSEGRAFSEVLKEAVNKGFTEPDPRIDLSGIDVARKVLILARELDLSAELDEVEIQNLVPPVLQSKTTDEMWSQITVFESHIAEISKVAEGEVVRYVGTLMMPNGNEPAHLFCGLERLPNNSTFGQVRGADGCFEIYTENYGSLPIVIRGAGAGAAVTAQGVFSDILRTAEAHIT
ncbi:Bifunctional aspartokinase/homoserine dehydrogenase 1 [Porphyromonas levii]|uniref:aspartate kinase n=1 Tax=Porphyromonas levii TaxID=28114 RepID=UPI001B8BA293|nr:aspartate kinase [Porphyromonas levii]MBR8729955.1 Bifunctional aspartokinase/homoserine dehydrogenase 1 [Porphyromonas levii]